MRKFTKFDLQPESTSHKINAQLLKNCKTPYVPSDP